MAMAMGLLGMFVGFVRVGWGAGEMGNKLIEVQTCRIKRIF